MFPFDENEEVEIDEEEESYIPREYEIDFKTGQLTGKILEGNAAIATWCWMALKTNRYQFYIYSWDYGSEFSELIGKNYSKAFLQTELERMVKDCVLENPYIEDIEEFSFEQDEEKLCIKFTIITEFGEEELEVNV